jgi:hypothetical protein
MDNIGYYLFVLAVIIIGVVLIKKIASCMVKTIVFLVLLAILAYIYLFLL